jgi:hypothetical protein
MKTISVWCLVRAGKNAAMEETMIGFSGSRRVAAGVGLGLVLGALSPARAHHSYAAFDKSKTVTMKAVVKIWQLVNPHSAMASSPTALSQAIPRPWWLHLAAMDRRAVC